MINCKHCQNEIIYDPERNKHYHALSQFYSCTIKGTKHSAEP